MAKIGKKEMVVFLAEHRESRKDDEKNHVRNILVKAIENFFSNRDIPLARKAIRPESCRIIMDLEKPVAESLATILAEDKVTGAYIVEPTIPGIMGILSNPEYSHKNIIFPTPGMYKEAMRNKKKESIIDDR